MLIASVYSLTSAFQFVEGKIDGDISCSSQGNGKTYCCANILDKNGYTSTTYCTMCDDTSPPSNCSPRERPMVVNPGGDLSNILEGTVLGDVGKLTEQPVLEQQTANVTILPGGSIQSNDTTNDPGNAATPDNEEMVTDDRNEDGESTQKQFSERADGSDDKENIDEVLPLE
jgi:hypothetical protein